MVSSKIEKQRQHYWEFVYSSNRTIAQVNPNVSKVEIDYTIHWFDFPFGKKRHQFTLLPESSVVVLEDCPNKDCISNGFDLSGVITTMLVQNKIEETSTIHCDRCSAYLEYSIKIEYTI